MGTAVHRYVLGEHVRLRPTTLRCVRLTCIAWVHRTAQQQATVAKEFVSGGRKP
jgi:hypothetical protein